MILTYQGDFSCFTDTFSLNNQISISHSFLRKEARFESSTSKHLVKPYNISCYLASSVDTCGMNKPPEAPGLKSKHNVNAFSWFIWLNLSLLWNWTENKRDMTTVGKKYFVNLECKNVWNQIWLDRQCSSSSESSPSLSSGIPTEPSRTSGTSVFRRTDVTSFFISFVWFFWIRNWKWFFRKFLSQPSIMTDSGYLKA